MSALIKAISLSVLVLAFLTLAGCGRLSADAGTPPEPGLEALQVVTDEGRHDLWVEIADDEEERARGLMFREPLADDRGMLFQFPDSAERAFYMRNTPASLDIIYIDAAGTVVSIARNTTPYSEALIPSYGAAKGVLEVRAGLAAEMGLEPGDRIVHPFFAQP